jgi:hypothetical protein
MEGNCLEIKAIEYNKFFEFLIKASIKCRYTINVRIEAVILFELGKRMSEQFLLFLIKHRTNNYYYNIIIL